MELVVIKMSADSGKNLDSIPNTRPEISDQLLHDFIRHLSLDDSYTHFSDEDDDDDFFPINPSGSVLMPSKEPYNKAEKMKQANLSLLSDEYTTRISKIKVRFAQKKKIFVYNGDSYTFEAYVFGLEDCTKEDIFEPDALSSIDKHNVTKRGNETKVLVVKMPNTESGETSFITNEFENDDVCIPMFSQKPNEKFGNEVQEQVANIIAEENYVDEKENLLEVKEEVVDENNQVEETESGIENNSGVLIKITSADSFESDITEFSEKDEIEGEQNTVLQLTNFKTDIESNDVLDDKNCVLLKTPLKVVRKSNKKLYTRNYKNGIKSKSIEESSQYSLYKSLDCTEKTSFPNRKKDLKKSNVAHIKSIDIDITPNCSDDCSSHSKKQRPKSCIEKKKSDKRSTRPFTAPVQRRCCPWGQPRLPEYNGLRSEYGLSAEQLRERKRKKIENNKARQEKKENKIKEEEQKRKQNEAKFCAWLENKKEQAHRRYLRNQHMFFEASNITTYPAPTSHLKKMGSLRSKNISKIDRNCISLEEILVNAKPREEKTYRIYLGVSVD